jgi:hypothetical protein
MEWADVRFGLGSCFITFLSKKKSNKTTIGIGLMIPSTYILLPRSSTSLISSLVPHRFHKRKKRETQISCHSPRIRVGWRDRWAWATVKARGWIFEWTVWLRRLFRILKPSELSSSHWGQLQKWDGKGSLTPLIGFSFLIFCVFQEKWFYFCEIFFYIFFCKVLVVGALRACLAQAHNSTSLVKLFFFKKITSWTTF